MCKWIIYWTNWPQGYIKKIGRTRIHLTDEGRKRVEI
jgi:hypothetical protein